MPGRDDAGVGGRVCPGLVGEDNRGVDMMKSPEVRIGVGCLASRDHQAISTVSAQRDAVDRSEVVVKAVCASLMGGERVQFLAA